MMVKATGPRVRPTVDVTRELHHRLDELAAHAGGSKSELLRKAIALIEIALQAKRKGNKIAIINNDGRIETTIVGL